MAYNPLLPADNDFISAGPSEIRANNEGLRTGRVVDAATVMGVAPGNTAGAIPLNNGAVNTNLNADMVDGKHASDLALVGHTHTDATETSDGFLSISDKQKLDGVAAGAQVNVPAFANVLSGGVTVQATSTGGTVELAPGTNISITPDNVNKRLTFSVSGKVASAASADTAAACTGNSVTSTNATNHIAATSGAHAASAISGLSAVATSGSYNDLSSKPASLPANGGTSAACSGLAATATALATARNINGVSFNGTADINITQVGGKNIATTDQIPAVATDYVISQSLGVNGYKKWKSGLIEQWGYIAPITVGGANANTIAVSFPTPFLTAVHNVVAGIANSTNQSGQMASNAYNWSLTGFTFEFYNPQGNNNTAGGTYTAKGY